MKLNPPGSSSDLDAAREIARRLSEAAYGGRAGGRWTSGALGAHVEADDEPLSPPTRAFLPSDAPRGTGGAPPPEPEPVPAEPEPVPAEAEPRQPEHAEPESGPAPVESAPAAQEPAPVEPLPPPQAPAEPAHPPARATGRSRVDTLLKQALGRAAALHPSPHKHEPVAPEPFVPLPAAPAAAKDEDEERRQWETTPSTEQVRLSEARTDPVFRVPEEVRDHIAQSQPAAEPEADLEPAAPSEEPEVEVTEPAEPVAVSPEPPAADEAFPEPVEEEAAAMPADADESPIGEPFGDETPSPFDAEAEAPPDVAETLGAASDDSPLHDALEDESATRPPFDVGAATEESPFGADSPFDVEPVAAEATDFDPSALVGAEPVAEEPPPPPPRPSWADVLQRCLKVAPSARGGLVAGADGRLIASEGQWPAPAPAIAGKLVPLINPKAPRPTETPLPIKLGPNVITSWRFEDEGELLTAAFVAEAAVPSADWPAIKELLRRQP